MGQAEKLVVVGETDSDRYMQGAGTRRGRGKQEGKGTRGRNGGRLHRHWESRNTVTKRKGEGIY